MNITANTTLTAGVLPMNVTFFYAATGQELNTSSTNFTTMYNTTAGQNNFTNGSLDISAITDGNTYNISAFFNNGTDQEWALVASQNVTLDNSAPVIYLKTPATATSATDATYNFTFNVTDPSSTVMNCSLVVDGIVTQSLTNGLDKTGATTAGVTDLGLGVAGHSWSVNCTNFLNLVGNSSSFVLTVEAAAAAAITASSPAPAKTWTKTFTASEDQFASGYSKGLAVKQRARFKVDKLIHQVGVKVITSGTVTIEVRSDPVEATLSVGDEGKFDVDGDGKYDLSVTLDSIENGRANLSIISVEEEATQESLDAQADADADAQDQAEGDTGVEVESEGSNWWIWVIVALVILAAAGFGVSKARK
jgi:hypothetical protein